MILPLSAVWAAAHGAFRALGFRSRVLLVGGRNVHLYDRVGRGKHAPILLVHGLGGAAIGFLPVMRGLLKASRRVVLIELPGHGRSRLGPAEQPASIIECAQAVGAALLEMGEPAVLVGNSLGGAISLYTAAAVPDRVRGVVGLNPAGAPLIGVEREAVVRAFRSGPTELLSRLYRRPPRGQWLFARDLERHFASPVVQALVGEFSTEDVPGIDPDLLAAITAPVLILWGEADRLLPAASVEYFRKALPRAAVETIPTSGHLPMVEASGFVTRRIVRFLEELP